ncbi:MAG: MlaE family ABC transporter permease [Candidatus Margulisiibacteriota bacterium]
MPYRKVAETVGHKTIEVLEEIGRVTQLGWETISGILRGNLRSKLIFEQMVKIGYESFPLALAASAFVGMVFAVQVATEFVKFGAGKYVGGVMAIAMARELGPALAGVVVAARVAAAIAAELGTMEVTEQIDALKALGSNPVKYLVIPRFIACAAMMPLLTIAADVVGFVGGYLVSIYVGQINPVEYMETARSLLKLWDVWGGLIKTIIFGMLISTIACYRGLSTRGGAKGVGEATTSSVVLSLITMFIVNYFLSIAFFK